MRLQMMHARPVTLLMRLMPQVLQPLNRCSTEDWLQSRTSSS
jgi:hypothetical protein